MMRWRGVCARGLGLITALAVLAAASAAQARPKGGGVATYLSFGGARADIGSLNERLKANGYRTFSRDYLGLGGGGFVLIGRVLVGGEGQSLFAQHATTGPRRAELDGGYGFFNVGYNVLARSSIILYPVVGIGGGGMTLEITEDGSVPFNDILADPKREARLTTSSLAFQVAFGGQYHVPVLGARGERGTAGTMLGLQGGYVFFTSQHWKAKGLHVTGSPDAGLSGPYVRVTVGLGGWSAQR